MSVPAENIKKQTNEKLNKNCKTILKSEKIDNKKIEDVTQNNIRYSAKDILRLFAHPKNTNKVAREKLKNWCYKAAQKNMSEYSSSKNPKFMRKAYLFFAIAALAGHPEAQFTMAEAYRLGLETVKIKANYAHAKVYYKAAANQGHQAAQRKLAYLYLHLSYTQMGIHSSSHTALQTKEKGFYWLKKAYAQHEAQERIDAWNAETKPKSSCVIS
jgi:TPR repeat protein